MRKPVFVGSSAILIVSVSSDIGEQLALDYLGRGENVVGTYRTRLPTALAEHRNFFAVRCDVSKPNSAAIIARMLRRTELRWTTFISCVGDLAPVGLFFQNDFEAWADSVHVNSVGQLRALHAAYPLRKTGSTCNVVFFAGGGTNNPFRYYSAYCLGKIALIKMCELLDDECPDLNVFAIGTGWVRTKIHRETLAARGRAGNSYHKTKSFLADKSAGTSHSDIAALIRWCAKQGRDVAGGRNFSAVHDGWRGSGRRLAASLKAEPNRFKLRRHGNQ